MLPLPYTRLPFSILALWLHVIFMLLANIQRLLHGQTSNVTSSTLNKCYGRRMIRTDQGYIGLAPRETKVGDRICLLQGIEYPFTIRQKSGSDEYLLIGESYLHGFMDGETVKKCHDIWLV
jgi:hypothetical protein